MQRLYRTIRGCELDLTKDISCPPPSNKRICAIAGSSPKLKFHIDLHVYHSTSDRKIKPQRVSNTTTHAVIQIYNVTREDEGVYSLATVQCTYPTRLLLVNLFIVNQTDLKTIVGQEGKEMEIKCSTNTVQYITGLHIESNGSIMEIGDNQSVSFLFIPNRTDHLTTYKCVDITHSSIMTEVKLIIRYPLPYQRNGRYMCFVSNGIPDTTGKVLQNWSTDVKYEGPPIFSPGNRNVKHGEVGISISMSFYIYSYPAVDEVNIEKIGQKQSKNEIIRYYNMINSTLRYTEFNNIIGTEGYEIVIESEVLEIYDFHAYLITVKNHLGESKYHFEIIDRDDTNLPNTDFLQIPPSVISSMDNIVNCKKINTNAETSSDQTIQNCSDSDSDTSTNVMIGDVGDGYENPYQTVLQNRAESHQYVEITNDRHTSSSSTDSNKSDEQRFQTGSKNEAVYTNLQF
ncbi:Hypothetical predicted protein [Mytilus galloprovincialis]|uniref:Ig-like domain-containing protein n=1 Tax=Mytilus galloprovincialis TaxID=29158 RepID=A0A8B6EDT9_MYTGA|nr:Hypothetical predicted protein [Mytilus galloprovincialis]